MIKLNAAMKSILSPDQFNSDIDKSLQNLLRGGLLVKDGCLFIRELLDQRRNENLRESLDETGREVFVNSFHTDDYVESNHVQQAIAFVNATEKLWEKDIAFKEKSRPKFVLSVTEFGVNVKFFLDRENQPYLLDDLEQYAQPIMSITLPNQSKV